MGSRFHVLKRRHRTENDELGTVNRNLAHEHGTRNVEHGTALVDLYGAQLPPWTLGLVEIEGHHFAGAGVGGQAAEVVD